MMMGSLAGIGVELPHYPNTVVKLGRPYYEAPVGRTGLEPAVKEVIIQLPSDRTING
jgi:hypothetical protein